MTVPVADLSRTRERTAKPSTAVEPVRLHIEGMTCGGCVATIERALQAVPGVSRARVNLSTQTASVELGPPATVPQLTDAVRKAGYEAQPVRIGAAQNQIDREHADQLRRQKQAMWQAIAVAAPVMGLHWLAPTLVSHEKGGHVWPHALQGLLTALLLASSAGAPILVGGLRAIIHRVPNMELLIALGVSVAFVAGVINTLTGRPDAADFHAAAMILAFINVGRFLELRARHSAASAVASLARHMPTTALLITADGIRKVPVDHLQPGDRVQVPGDHVIPVDGAVIEGEAAVDESSLTGEPLPRRRGTGEQVAAGALVREGALVIEATRVGASSTMGRMIRAVEEAQAGKTRMQRVADRVAGVFVPVVVALSLATLAGTRAIWPDLGWAEAIQRAVAVLVISCPCALGLATPAAVMVATGKAASMGILVRDVAALERAASIDHLLLDKTGTITTGRLHVAALIAAEGPSHEIPNGFDGTLLGWAASVEQFSQHPLARAVVQEAMSRNIALETPTDFNSRPGAGVRARIADGRIVVGSNSYMEETGIALAGNDEGRSDDPVRSRVAIALDGTIRGWIEFEDTLRPHAKEAVDALSVLGVQTSLLSGDQRPTVEAVASQVGIRAAYAEMSPHEKHQKVRQLRANGHRVGMAGDGLNDAAALAEADIGITFASATDVAIGAAGITIVHEDLRRLPQTVLLARRSLRIIRQNLFWAFFYNLLAIPLAALGKISPGIAAAAMMFSSISVVLNSLRLAGGNDQS